MNRDRTLFVLWNVAVLGMVAVTAQMGWLAPLVGNGRELAVAVIGGLYLLGVLLCGSLMWRLACGEVPFMPRRLRGIDLVIRLVVLIGLAGTVYGVVLGTSGMGAAADGGSDAAVRVVGTMGHALGLGFTANLFSILAAAALLVSRHFVGNAVAWMVAEHG